jgi:diguanylate cyclase (GGDEF)-like protein
MLHTLANNQAKDSTSAYFPQLDGLFEGDYRLNVASLLQNSLDLHETLASFYQVLQQLVRCSGIEYTHAEKNICLSLGTKRAHVAEYNLNLGDATLGKMRFFRGVKIKESELSSMETLLALLVVPLRNVLMYRDALENSLRDGLTKTGNRNALEQVLQRELKLSQRYKHPLSLMVIDVDSFKQINDQFGHDVGDQLLLRITQTIQTTLRDTDQVFRYGGDEFVVLLPNTDEIQGKAAAERIRAMAAQMGIPGKSQEIWTTLSIGVSSFKEGDTQDSLFKRADQALYLAKAAGRNTAILG